MGRKRGASRGQSSDQPIIALDLSESSREIIVELHEFLRRSGAVHQVQHAVERSFRSFGTKIGVSSCASCLLSPSSTCSFIPDGGIRLRSSFGR